MLNEFIIFKTWVAFLGWKVEVKVTIKNNTTYQQRIVKVFNMYYI